MPSAGAECSLRSPTRHRARSADVAVLYATIFVGIYKFIIDGAVGGARAVQARAKAQFDAVRSLRGY